MSDTLAKFAKHADRVDRVGRRAERHRSSTEEDGALRALRREARAAGATLLNAGVGSLPSSLVLHVMRRDGYVCKIDGCRNRLTVHHKSETAESKWLVRKANDNTPAKLVTIGDRCHDRLHEKAREEGVAS